MTLQAQTIHRVNTGRSFYGLPVHAAAGIHELVATLVVDRFGEKVKVLEVGGGSGAMASFLADHGFEVLSIEMDVSSWQGPKESVVQADVNEPEWVAEVPWKPDLIICVEVIEHLENPSRFFQHLGEISKPTTALIVTTPNVVCSESVLDLLRMGHLVGFSPDQVTGSGHVSILPHWMIQAFAEAAGFRMVDLVGAGNTEASLIKRMAIRLVRMARRMLRARIPRVLESGVNVIMVMELDRGGTS